MNRINWNTKIVSGVLILLAIFIWITYSQFALQSEWKRNSVNINFATYSPDGKWVVTTKIGGVAGREPRPSLTILNSNSGIKEADLDYGGTAISAVFSHDGNYLVTAVADNRIIIWDVDGWDLLAETDFLGLSCDLSAHPNETLVAIASCGPAENGVYIIDLDNELNVKTIAEYLDSANSQVSFNHDGELIAYSYTNEAGGSEVIISNVKDGNIQKHSSQHLITDIIWHPTYDSLLYSTDVGQLFVWGSDSEPELVINQNSMIESIALSSDGAFLVLGGIQPATLYNAITWAEVKQYGHGNVKSIRLSPNNKTLAIVTINSNTKNRLLTIVDVDLEDD